MSSARKLPNRWPEASAASTMTTTPSSATTLAASVVQRSRSPVHAQAIAAVRNGAVALITKTSATVVWRSALMKQTVARVEQPATTRPARPIRRKASAAPAPCRQTM